jgi:hypothetical protein
MIRKGGRRFSEKIMLNKMLERDDAAKNGHPPLGLRPCSRLPAPPRQWGMDVLKRLKYF